MGAEFPPIIIDGSGCMPNSDDERASSSFSMRASTGAVAATKLDPTAVASLFLIRNNRLHHEGDFRLEDVELVCGDDTTVASRTNEACLRLSNATVHDQGSGLCQIGGSAAQAVKAIRVKGRQEGLRYGQDFHNFLLIMKPRA